MSTKKCVAYACIMSFAWVSFAAAEFHGTDTSFRCHEPGEIRLAHMRLAKNESISTICTKGSTAFALIEKDTETRQLVRGAIYSFRSKRTYKEHRAHVRDVLCEINPSSSSRKLSYICFNPTVGAGIATAVEYSFLPSSGTSHRRKCTIVFGSSQKKKCL